MIIRREISIYPELFKDIVHLIRLGAVLKGKAVGLFEENFAKYIGTKYAIATFSGRKGLELILESFKFEKGTEILVPAYTLGDLLEIIKRLRFKPILVDIDLNSFNMSSDLIENRISERTRAVLVTHIFGMPCNIDKFLGIAEKYNLKVIEDCAHAAGASYKGKKVGSFGDAAFFSFDMLKPINTFGGGMITTNNKNIRDFVKDRLRGLSISKYVIFKKMFLGLLEHFLLKMPPFCYLPFLMSFPLIKKNLAHLYKRIHKTRHNYSYSNLQALIGLRQLNNLDGDNRKRNDNVSLLKNSLDNNFIFQKAPQNSMSTYYQFVILTKAEKINLLRRKFFMKGIDCAIKEEILDDCSLIENVNNCPNSRYCFNHFIQIPIYKGLKVEEIHYISRILSKLVDDFYR